MRVDLPSYGRMTRKYSSLVEKLDERVGIGDCDDHWLLAVDVDPHSRPRLVGIDGMRRRHNLGLRDVSNCNSSAASKVAKSSQFGSNITA